MALIEAEEALAYFNPRSSYEERRQRFARKSINTEFQSTLLIRGATYNGTREDLAYLISIHAPHTRSDLQGSVTPDNAVDISIHAPHTRSDVMSSVWN